MMPKRHGRWCGIPLHTALVLLTLLVGPGSSQTTTSKEILVRNASIGDSSSCVHLYDGTTKCWGGNRFGQLGTGHNLDIGSQPSQMGNNLGFLYTPFGVQIKQMCATSAHSCALYSNGRVKCWGISVPGFSPGHILGFDPSDSSIVKESVSYPGMMSPATIVKYTPTLPYLDLGTSNGMPVQVKQLACYGDGGMYTDHTTCALLVDGRVKCWGSNRQALLGNGQPTNYVLPVPQGMGDALPAIDFGNSLGATFITMGTHYGGSACAILVNGDLKCWGTRSAKNGQIQLEGNNWIGDQAGEIAGMPPVFLGQGRKAVQVSCGQFQTCVLLDNDEVRCFGDSSYGVLGPNAPEYDTVEYGSDIWPGGTPPPLVSFGTKKVLKIKSYGKTNCAHVYDASAVPEYGESNHLLSCWGELFFDSTGLSHTGNPSSRGVMNIRDFYMGNGFACVLHTDGKLSCFGSNNVGQLGTGDSVSRSLFPAFYPQLGTTSCTADSTSVACRQCADSFSPATFAYSSEFYLASSGQCTTCPIGGYYVNLQTSCTACPSGTQSLPDPFSGGLYPTSTCPVVGSVTGGATSSPAPSTGMIACL